jgi:peptidoglycan/xylan/chitin deacetylase (PgdA/CDA1 family)
LSERPPYTRASLQDRRARRRRVHLRRRLTAAVTLTLILVFGVVTISHGGDGDAPPPADAAALFGHHPRIFPAPDRLASLPYVAIAGKRHREVALTFDDGPGPYTIEVVRTLRRLQVPATFFQVGVTAHYFTDAQQAEIADPLVTIGDHTQSHKRLDKMTAAQQAAEIDAQAAVARAMGAPAPSYFRPPYGAYDEATLALLRERHMTMVMWSVDSEDYRRPGVDKIVDNVMREVEPGAIILMHDAGGDRSQTIAALPRIVKALRDRDYTLVSLTQLLHDAPPPVKQPVMGVGAG